MTDDLNFVTIADQGLQLALAEALGLPTFRLRLVVFVVAGMIGVVVLMLGNLVIGLFTHSAGILRDGGPIAIIFSLVCIGLAAFSFLIDFDSADQLIRAGAPEKAAWGIALGLTVTLVWLYLEILRLLTYFNSDR